MSSVAKNFIYNTGYQILAIIIPIVTMPYLARVIGANGMGQYSYANSIAYYFVMFIMMGLNNYGNRTIAGVRNNRELLSKRFFEIYTMQLIFGLIAVLCYVFYCVTLARSNSLCWPLGLYVISAVLDINWLYFGLERFRFTVTRNTIIKIISTVAIFCLIKNENDLIWYVLIIMMSFVLSNLVLWPALFKEISWCKVCFKDVIKHIKPNLILFIPIIAVSLYKYMDKIMLGSMSSMEQVGYYEYAEKIIQIPIAIVNSLATVMLPRMSNLVAVNNTEKEHQYIKNSIIIAIFLSSSLCFGLMGIAEEFVKVFFGINYMPCILLFYILLPSCCFIAFASVIRTQYLIPHKHDKVFIESVIVGALLNIIVNYLMIPRLQAAGAAVGTLIAEIVVCIYQAVRVRKMINIKEQVQNSIPFILAGVIMFVALNMINIKHVSLYVCILIKVILGVVIYFIVLRCIFVIRNNEYEYIKSLVKR